MVLVVTKFCTSRAGSQHQAITTVKHMAIKVNTGHGILWYKIYMLSAVQTSTFVEKNAGIDHEINQELYIL